MPFLLGPVTAAWGQHVVWVQRVWPPAMGHGATVAPATRCLPHRAAWSGIWLTQAAHDLRCRCSFLPESNWGANAGLAVARDLLEPVKQKVGFP